MKEKIIQSTKNENDVILSPADGNCSGSQPCKQRDPEQQRLRMTACMGFTLVELLVVVLIIGILSAIAIPMYQGAVDKSHWSTMLPASKAIKDAEEAFKMTNGEYSDTMEHLDVQMNNSDLTFTLNTPNNLSQPNVIRVTNSKLDNVRLASYLDTSPLFAGQLHCEAKTGDERAIRLCDKLLQGSEFFETDDGYMGYLLNQEVDSGVCKNAQGSWSTSKTKCYKDTATRCEALGFSAIAGKDLCGIENGPSGTYGPEKVCLANDTSAEWKCSGKNTKIDGGACINIANKRNCHQITVTNGGICVTNGNGSYGEAGCTGSFTNGSICYSNVSGGCGGHRDDHSTSYDSTSCCCGLCGKAPTCASRGITCDPYYMDPNNFTN